MRKTLQLIFLILPATLFAGTADYKSLRRSVPAQPASVVFSDPTSSTITVSWEKPESDSPITLYTLQRRDDAGGPYNDIYSGIDLSFTSTGLVSGVTYFFRVKAHSVEGESFFSPENNYIIGQMVDGEFTTCDFIFLDPEGNSDYKDNSDMTMTFFPGTPGNKIKVSFISFQLEFTYDKLHIYDGPDTSTEPIAILHGTSLPDNYFSSHETGALTFRFTSDRSVTKAGWEAVISCYTPGTSAPVKPKPVSFSPKENNSVEINWVAPFDYGSDITEYTVERKAEAEGSYGPAFQGSGVSYIDAGLQDKVTYYYRVKATNGIGDSDYSDEISYVYGQMLAGSVVGCSVPFLDPGGKSNYPNISHTVEMTFAPESPDDKLKVSFSEFSVVGSFDYLEIFEGPDRFGELLASVTGSSIPGPYVSGAAGGELTFRFRSSLFENSSGWEALITCEALGTIVPARPDPVTFSALTPSSVRVNWVEPYDFESAITAYTLEHRIGLAEWTQAFSGPSLSFDALSLEQGVTYSYRVKATNVNGDSYYSEESKYTPGQMVSGTAPYCATSFLDPGGLGNYPTSVNMIMTFTPENPGEKVKVSFATFNLEAGYDHLYVYNGLTSLTQPVATLTGGELPADIISESEDGSLTFKFISDEVISFEGWEAAISCVSVPDQLAMVAIGTLTSTSAELSWTAPGSGGLPITAYKLEQKSGADGSYSEIYAGESLSYTSTGLTPGTTYFFRVLATNEMGSSAYSEEASVCIPFKWFKDEDGDSFGDPEISLYSCADQDGYVKNADDCNDADAAVSPNTVWYADADGDGYGDAAVTKTGCAQPEGYVSDKTDCNDGEATVYPGATELFDGLDNNCDGTNDDPNQTITFAALEEKVFADGGLIYTLNASANTGLAVEFTVEGTSASISGNKLTVSAPGSYTVTASQAGNSYFSAAQTSQTTCVFPPQAVLTDGSAETPPVITLGNPFSGTVHHWYLNDELLLESSETILPLTQSGSYKVKMVSGGCEGVFSEALEIDLGGVTGLDAKEMSLLQIYPNPADGIITIKASGELQSIGMYGLDGKEVYKTAVPGSSAHVVDLQKLLPGTYILITQLSDGRRTYSRIIRK